LASASRRRSRGSRFSFADTRPRPTQTRISPSTFPKLTLTPSANGRLRSGSTSRMVPSGACRPISPSTGSLVPKPPGWPGAGRLPRPAPKSHKSAGQRCGGGRSWYRSSTRRPACRSGCAGEGGRGLHNPNSLPGRPVRPQTVGLVEVLDAAVGIRAVHDRIAGTSHHGSPDGLDDPAMLGSLMPSVNALVKVSRTNCG